MSDINGSVVEDDVMFVDVHNDSIKRKASDELNNPPSMKILHSDKPQSWLTAESNPSSTIPFVVSPNPISESGSVDSGTWQMLKLSFEDEGVNFITIPWPQIKRSLDKVSITWRFIAISSDHKAVTIKESDSAAISHFVATNTIVIEEKQIKVSVKILKENKNKGIIYNKFLIPIQEDTILELLRDQSVIEVKKIVKPDGDGNTNSTGSVILIFDKPGTPEYVVIDQINVKVSKLNPRPMQCFHCMNFGHVEKRCQKKEIILCRTCFYEHDTNSECNPVCKNCNFDHRSNSKRCPSYLREIEILKVKENGQISYVEAKKVFEKANKQNKAIQDISNSDELSLKDDTDELRSKFLKLNSDLKKSRDNEKSLMIENLKYKEQIVPSLEAKIINLEIELRSTKNKHIAAIKKVYEENSNTLEDLSQQNIEAAKTIEAVKQNLKLAKNKLIEAEVKSQEANQKLNGFINSNNTIKKEYEKFYVKMNKSGDRLYPTRSRSTSP